MYPINVPGIKDFSSIPNASYEHIEHIGKMFYLWNRKKDLKYYFLKQEVYQFKLKMTIDE